MTSASNQPDISPGRRRSKTKLMFVFAGGVLVGMLLGAPLADLFPIDEDEARLIAYRELRWTLERLSDVDGDRLPRPKIEIQSDGTRLFMFDDRAQNISIAISVKPNGRSDAGIMRGSERD